MKILARDSVTSYQSSMAGIGTQGTVARSLLASACTKFEVEQASENSGANRASCGRTLSTSLMEQARLLLWRYRARKRPI